MKKLILLFSVLMVLADAIAQTDVNIYEDGKTDSDKKDQKNKTLPPVKMGFMFTVHVDRLSSEIVNRDQIKNRMDGSWGFIINLQLKQLNPNYYLSTGFNINSLSTKVSSDAGGKYYLTNDTIAVSGMHQQWLRNKYFDVPLMLHLETGKPDRKFAFYGDIGFVLGWLMKSKATITHTPIDDSTPDEFMVELRDDMNRFRADFTVGGGIGLPLDGQSMLTFAIKYNYGLNNLTSTDKPLIPELKSASLNYLSFGLGILF